MQLPVLSSDTIRPVLYASRMSMAEPPRRPDPPRSLTIPPQLGTDFALPSLTSPGLLPFSLVRRRGWGGAGAGGVWRGPLALGERLDGDQPQS